MNYLVLSSLVSLSRVTWLYSLHSGTQIWYICICFTYMYAVPWSKDLKSNVHKQYYTEKFIYKYFFETCSYLVWCRLYGCYHSLCGCYGDHLEENMAQILEGYQGGCWNSQKHLCKSKPDPCFVFPDSVGFRNQRRFFLFLLFYYLHTLASW